MHLLHYAPSPGEVGVPLRRFIYAIVLSTIAIAAALPSSAAILQYNFAADAMPSLVTPGLTGSEATVTEGGSAWFVDSRSGPCLFSWSWKPGRAFTIDITVQTGYQVDLTGVRVTLAKDDPGPTHFDVAIAGVTLGLARADSRDVPKTTSFDSLDVSLGAGRHAFTITGGWASNASIPSAGQGTAFLTGVEFRGSVTEAHAPEPTVGAMLVLAVAGCALRRPSASRR